MVCDNWDQLNTLWGGLPAVVCSTNCTTTLSRTESLSDSNDDEELNEDNDGIHNDEEEDVVQNRDGRVEKYLKVHLKAHRLHGTRCSSKEFRIKIGN